MKKILVPCDFSDSGVQACKFAADMTVMRGGEALALNAADGKPVPESTFSIPSFVDDQNIHALLRNEYRRYYMELMRAHSLTDPSHSSRVLPGTANQFEKIIDDEQADLVVLGTSDISLTSEFTGVNATYTKKRSSVPIISLRRSITNGRIQSILLPVTMDPIAPEFVVKVRLLSDLFNARIHLLLIKKELFEPSDISASLFLNAFARHYNISNRFLEVRTTSHPVHAIIEYASDEHIDMIAWGVHV